MRRLLVTGGAGFIGSHFVRQMLDRSDVERITVLDALTYAGNTDNLGPALDDPKLEFVRGNILDAPLVADLVSAHTEIVHLAAESHVDRSFFEAANFVSTNVLGTQTLLDAVAKTDCIRKFVHVSTDEVYGSWPTGAATENAALRPTVPYAASKAASDLVAISYFHTFGVPVCVTRSSNNYGPNQHPEKIIPRFVTSLLKGEPVTIHGNGEHVRNWLFVTDNTAGIELVLRRGIPGEIYNLGGGVDLSNNELTRILLELCGAGWDAVNYIPDRQANDQRYAMDHGKATHDLGYQPATSLADGLVETVTWYRDRPERWAPARRDPQAVLPRISLAETHGVDAPAAPSGTES